MDRRKFLTYATAQVMRECYIEPSLSRRLITYAIAGNHDCPFRDHNNVNALHEMLNGKEGFKVYSDPETIYIEDVQVLMLPWIAAKNRDASMREIAKTEANIVFAHLELVGFETSKGRVMEHGMEANPFRRFGGVYTGHYHHRSSRGNIHYLGTPYEMTWMDCDDPKGFHILDTDTLELEFIRNPHTIFQKATVSDKLTADDVANKFIKLVVNSAEDQKKLDAYLSKLETKALDIQVLDEQLDFDNRGSQLIDVENVEDTMQIVSDYVMASDGDVDKDALIAVIRELYLEAQNG